MLPAVFLVAGIAKLADRNGGRLALIGFGVPALLIVSIGTAEANRVVGLPAITLLRQGFSAGPSISASGTPSVVLVDTGGTIASGVAVGA